MDPMWLSCDISRGMFPHEKAVCIKTTSRMVSFFLPTEQIRLETPENGRGEIQVGVLDVYEQTAVVYLPEKTIEEGRMVKVPKAHLRK